MRTGLKAFPCLHFCLLVALLLAAIFSTLSSEDRGNHAQRLVAPWLDSLTFPAANNNTMCNLLVQIPQLDVPEHWDQGPILVFVMSDDYSDIFNLQSVGWEGSVQLPFADPTPGSQNVSLHLLTPKMEEYTVGVKKKLTASKTKPGLRWTSTNANGDERRWWFADPWRLSETEGHAWSMNLTAETIKFDIWQTAYVCR